MSRGFIKEDDLEHSGTALTERPISSHPNYVTPEGLAQLEYAYHMAEAQRLDWLTRKEDTQAAQVLASLDRDLRYYATRLAHVILVDPKGQANHTVLFGAVVTVVDSEHEQHIFHIVGEDEANAGNGKVSYVSPIARALLGRKIGETVEWTRPAGTLTLEILNIFYQKV